VTNFEYDPNRSAFLAKVYHDDNKKNINENEAFSYILAPKGLKIFDKVISINERTKNILFHTGDSSILANFEFGDLIHNVENIPGRGGLFARAAGTFCQVLQTPTSKYIRLRLPSGSQRLISIQAKATLGVVSNEEHILKNLKKAGRSR
jgi:large subunit ribosomal protein L2